jgi:hypothetical protein
LKINQINFIFDAMNKYPNELNIDMLFIASRAIKDGNTYEDSIKAAFRIKEIFYYNTNNIYDVQFSYDTSYLFNASSKFPDEYFQRFITLLKSNVEFSTAYDLSNPSRNFTNVLVDKFMKLKAELNIDDKILLRHLRNNKNIDKIRLFKSKNISSNGIINLLNIDKEILDNLIENNNIYDFDERTWSKIELFWRNNNEIYKDIFTKFTIKQQNNLRIKQLMEDGGYDELKVNYIKENIIIIYNFPYVKTIQNITLQQFVNSYFELTQFQMNTLFGFLGMNFTYEEALSNTYQTIESEH